MQYVQMFHQVSFIAGVIFSVSFVLTLWPGQRRLKAAAVLYSVGILTTMGALAYYLGIFVGMTYGLSDSGRPNTVALVGLIWPIGAIGYAVSAVAFLWPSISQKKALRWGKIVHMAIGLPLIVATHALDRPAFTHGLEVGWLVYALLWFRIRENYVTGAQS
jgi:hypothetical protein